MKNFFIKFLGNWRHQVSRVEVEELLTKHEMGKFPPWEHKLWLFLPGLNLASWRIVFQNG
jgi:hypothetical protein